MPINSTHPEFDISRATVSLDAYNGTVLDYVPQLTKQTSEEYEAYRQRGTYFNVIKRTTEALIGACLRKPFLIDPQDINIDGDQSPPEFVSQLIRGVLLEGRQGILVDFDDIKQQPYLCQYSRENIVNWRDDKSLIVLREFTYVPDPDDEYELITVERYRELYIDEGVYQVRIWTPKNISAREKVFVISEEYTPTIRGETLSFIPFTFITPYDTTTASYDPVLYNLAQLNISHFKTTVDLEHGCHFTALPTPVIKGDFASDPGNSIAIGSTSPWHLEADADAYYLEFSGNGLSALERRLEDKQQQMAFLGSRLLVDKKGIESAEALTIRSGAETATLNNVVTAVEAAMRQSLGYYVTWLQGDINQVEFEMSRDFTNVKLSPQEMQALMSLYTEGLISQETFLENLYAGEITPEVQEEINRLNRES